MAKTQDIKRRIRSVRNTGKLTKAMKMVAAAKLRRAQEQMLHADEVVLELLAAHCHRFHGVARALRSP